MSSDKCLVTVYYGGIHILCNAANAPGGGSAQRYVLLRGGGGGRGDLGQRYVTPSKNWLQKDLINNCF